MRNLDPTLLAELPAPVIQPVFLVDLTFRSQNCFVTSAGFNIGFNGQSYLGVGSLGSISPITEGTEVRAEGLTLTLSGVDPTILAECEADILPLAPAQIWLGLLSQGQFLGVPYRLFRGVVDSPTITTTPTEAKISLKLESRMALLNRPSQRRYTPADQHANGHPLDTAFNWVTKLQDIALRFGN